MKLHNIRPDILKNGANQVRVSVESSVGTRDRLISERIEELSFITWKSSIQCLLESREAEEIVHRLGSVALTVEPVGIDVPAVWQLNSSANHFAERGDYRIRFEDAEFIERLRADLKSFSERIVRVVSGNDEKLILPESATIGTLVRSVRGHLLSSINEEAIIELKQASRLVFIFD